MRPSPTTAYPIFLAPGMNPDLCATRVMDQRRTEWRSALPVGPAQFLISNRRVVQAAQFLQILENLVDGIGHGVGVFLTAQKILVWEPDRFLIRGFFRFGTRKQGAQVQRFFSPPAQRREIGRIDGKKRAFV